MLRLFALFQRGHVVAKVAILAERQIIASHQKKYLGRRKTLENLKILEGLILPSLYASRYKVTRKRESKQSQRY